MRTRVLALASIWASVVSLCAADLSAAASEAAIEFDRDVRPILSDRCFVCHGPDAEDRQADLRLDEQAGAFAALDDDMYIIRPGDLQHSEVYRRISSDDPDERMPPADSNLALSRQEITTLRRWIEQGAPWAQHWSFRPLRRQPVPEVKDGQWPRGAIDRFVLSRLERSGLRPAAPAGKERLIRRLSFDLTGLPPTLDEIDAFLADTSPGAYERLVDRLLSSPHFGERMATDWLDVARYADTYGYQADVYRAMWPWRDWVVGAFNRNMPFDQFVTWQLAGDLLPNATQEQVLATAFNRLHRQTNEGGSVEEEFRAEYVSDRVNTFATSMLGLTLGCARCHDHKFDPVTQKEYYQLSAFFNSIDESGLYSHFTDAVPTPTLVLMDETQRANYKSLQEQIAAAEGQLAQFRQSRREAFETWLTQERHSPDIPGLIGDFPLDNIDQNKVANRADSAKPGTVAESPQPVPGRIGQALKLSGENNVSVPAGGDFTRNNRFSIAIWINTPDEKDRAVILHRSRAWTDAGSRGYQLLIENGCLSASLIHFWPGNAIRIRTTEKVPTDCWVHVVMTYDGSSRADGLTLYVNGRAAECDTVRDNLFKNITGGGATTLTVGQRFRDRGFKNGLVDELQVFNRRLTPLEVAQLYDGNSLAQALAARPDALSADQRQALSAYYLENYDESYGKHLAKLTELRKRRSKAIDPVLEIMVMRELPAPRPTFLLQRGAYDASGERVYPGTPKCLPPWPKGQPRNRLGLAHWLTDPQHPLLARTTVNRFWQAMFGRGLVATSEDLGSQGELPTHPLLLDWLARSFIDSDWDVKALVKQIVLSATYRQDSDCPADLRARDPDNRWLARGPRYRLPAEMIRDNALFAGTVLVDKLGGAPVKPFQPAGLWKEKSGKVYQRDKGEGSHRRSLYTFWKRTSPPPAMMILDAAKRDICVARRQTTATPLQALVLWNDPQYVEAARGLAEHVLAHSPDVSAEQQLRVVFRTLTGRWPAKAELDILVNMHREQRDYFEQDPARAASFVNIGDRPPPDAIDPIPLAALSAVAGTLLSYDETITKR